MRRVLIGLPFLFALHELEEYWTALPWLHRHASDLPRFISEHIPQQTSFVLETGIIFFIVYAIAAALVVRRPVRGASSTVLAVLVLARLENGMGHIAHALWFQEYTPGLLTAVLVVIPVAFFVLKGMLRQEMIARKSLVWMIPVALITQTIALIVLYYALM